ncbi:hypothetical protein SK128_006019 [Halocaridina rubra]|uniref:Uncharacterized protein n=1 Tax=Halocaridina rubra TaxID=373956 RepID=A0AAN8XU74_HALRR
MTVWRRDADRANSVSMQHRDHFLHSRYKYHRCGLMVRKHNVVSARLRMGYWPLWQVSQTLDMPQYTSCILCDCPNANTLDHYCLHCPTVRDVLPRGQNLIQICSFLLNDDNLDVSHTRYPHSGGDLLYYQIRGMYITQMMQIHLYKCEDCNEDIDACLQKWK